jgi:cobalt/nickel transport system permease protein
MHHAFMDKFAHLESPVHRLDPRAKIISSFFFVLMVVLTSIGDYLAFGLFLALISIILAVSMVPFTYVFRHSLLVLPFAGLVGLSLLFVKEGDVIWSFASGPLLLTVSYEGLHMFLTVLLKSWLSVLAMLMLVSTTRFPALLKGLEWFRVPSLMLMVISFMYRYIFLLTDELMRMKAARDSRGQPSGIIENLDTAGSMIGSLFVRSYERAEKAYLAMCSRGFDGQIRTVHSFSIGVNDMAFVLLFCSFALAIYIMGWSA